MKTTRRSAAGALAATLGSMLGLGLMPGTASTAQSKDLPAEFYPVLSGDGDLELRLDAIPQSDDTHGARYDMFLEGEANLGLSFTPEFSLQSRIKADSVRAPRPGRDRYIAGTGVFLEQLYADYQTDNVGAYAGKFGPTFGIAWDRLPDLLKDGISGDYELAEMIGFGGTLKFDFGTLGKHEVNAAAFFLDTTLLHRSLFSTPSAGDDRAERISHLRRDDGGLANTGKPNNFSATVDGGAFAGLPELFYQIGYRHLAPGVTERKSEEGVIGSVGYNFRMADEVVLTPFVEIAHFWNFNGGNADATVVTAALQANAEPWNISVAGSWRNIGRDAGTPHTHDYSAGFQVGYSLGSGFEIGAGYRHERIDGIDADIVRSYIGYSFEFTKPLGG